MNKINIIYLEQLWKRIKKLIGDEGDTGLYVSKKIEKSLFNIFYMIEQEPKTFIHIHIGKFKVKEKQGQLYFKPTITYNKPGKKGRIKGAPGTFKTLLERIKKVYPGIRKILEKEEFLNENTWEKNFIPLGKKDDIKEHARRITILACLKLFFEPAYKINKDKFEKEKFEKIYNKKLISTNSKENKNETLHNILNTINTKPFIILSGISGTGKTQIARIISAGIIKDKKKNKNKGG